MTDILLQHAGRADAPRDVAAGASYLKDRRVNVVSVPTPSPPRPHSVPTPSPLRPH